MRTNDIPYDEGFDLGETSELDDRGEVYDEARAVCPYSEQDERRAFIAGFLDGAGFNGTKAIGVKSFDNR